MSSHFLTRFCARAISCRLVFGLVLISLAGGCKQSAETHFRKANDYVAKSQLPEAIVEEIMPRFGLACTAADRQRLLELTRYDAKDSSRQRLFRPDSRATVSPAPSGKQCRAAPGRTG